MEKDDWICPRCGSSFEENLKSPMLDSHPLSTCVKLLAERVKFLEEMVLKK